ncbi:hypothetical protein [Diaphorobacter sp.]|uniref:hypothetical protein n=1 Tax=Diaphorobacter sp. TaxID=1934310 RepID=UPI0028A2679F|nr:hypothetical protein [Diaphorobacter sp.]
MSNDFLSTLFSDLFSSPSQGIGHDSSTSAMSSPSLMAGPDFNIDGTPMLDSVFDVTGKVYGDSGSSFGSDW